MAAGFSAGIMQSGTTGLIAEWIAEQLSLFGVLPLVALVGIVVLVIIFLTEVTSNTATAAAFLPLLGALALSLDISPLLITVPAAIAASCAFMMERHTRPRPRMRFSPKTSGRICWMLFAATLFTRPLMLFFSASHAMRCHSSLCLSSACCICFMSFFMSMPAV